MKSLHRSLLAAVLTLPALLIIGTTQAAPVFGPGNSLNEMEFGNVEVQLRLATDCTAVGGCLATGDSVGAGVTPALPAQLANYRYVDPSITNNVNDRSANPSGVGDLFLGIFTIREISNNVTGATWAQSLQPDLDQFTGYFLQEVDVVNFVSLATPDPFDIANTALDHIELVVPSVADPFGILGTDIAGGVSGGTGEMFAIFRDMDPMDADTQFTNIGPMATDISNATDGTLWATLGPGVGLCDELNCTSGYAYTHADITLTLATFEGRGLIGVNNQFLGPAYNAGNLAPINDPQENESVAAGGGGGFATPPLPNGACIGVPGTFRCTEYILTSEIDQFTSGFPAGGTSPWVFQSADPVRIFRVPEPGSVALIGLGLLGLAGVSRRRRKLRR